MEIDVKILDKYTEPSSIYWYILTKLSFILRMQRWFKIRKSNLTDLRGTSYVIMSIDAGKAFDKIQHLLTIKKKKTSSNSENYE